MPVGNVTKYDGFESVLNSDAGRQWDNPTAGSCMFILCTDAHTPLKSHVTVADLTGVITAGDGAPINVVNPALDKITTPGSTYVNSDPANFGASVTITAKYLMCVQPVIVGTHAATSKLLTYVDLNTTDANSSLISVAGDYSISPAVGGWAKTT